MEIAGLHAAQKRLQVAYNIAQSGEGLLRLQACWVFGICGMAVSVHG